MDQEGNLCGHGIATFANYSSTCKWEGTFLDGKWHGISKSRRIGYKISLLSIAVEHTVSERGYDETGEYRYDR